MKISQKLVSLRCRVLVKNKRLVVFWLLIKMHVLIAGVKSRRMHLFLLHVSIFKHSKPHAPFFPYVDAGSPCLIPAEVDLTWAVSPLLYQWLMEFTSCTGVDICPTKLTVILQASDIGTEERSKTFHHIVRPGIRHTSGHPTHMALPPLVYLYRHAEVEQTEH